MGFYGNITSVNKSTFQFDKIYANRFEMDANCETDGVFIGRFVLVDYDKGSSLSHGINEEEVEKTKITPAYMVTDETGAISFHTGNSYATPQFLLADTDNCDVNDAVIEKDALILILGRRRVEMIIRDHTIYDASQSQDPNMVEILAHETDYESMIPQLWKCTGAGRMVRFLRTKTDENGDPVLDENDEPIIEALTCTTAGFEKLAIDYNTEDDTGVTNDYNANYTTDMTNYTNSGRGWDSTVWQKTWKDGKAKYVMIAELNSVVPTFDISVDAPTETPLIPHWSEDSSNVYYKLHVQPQWGLRIKGKPGSFYSTDEKDYPSDVKGAFVIDSKLESEVLQKIGKRIKVDANGNPLLDEEGNYEIETYTIELDEKQQIADDEFNTFPLAIYWNKAGFDPYQGSDAIKDMILQKALPEDSRQAAAAARFVGQSALNDGEDLNEWASKWALKDSIAFRPSGLSGNTYNKHGGLGTLFNNEALPDTYELSVMLPSLGQAMSDIWDIVYGKSTVYDINGRTLWHKETGRFASGDLNQQMRNANYEWDTYNGPRMVSELAPQDEQSNNANGYLKYNKGLMTSLVANINSAHDLMGMIIRDFESNLNNVADWDPTKIYFVNGAYYRKHKGYTYTNVTSGENIEQDSYATINNMIDLATSQTPIYRIDLGEFPTFEEPELQNVSNKKFNNYRLASGGKEDYVDGAKYVTLSPGPEAELSLQGYEPNSYFIKITNQPTLAYELDRSNTPSIGAVGNYYKITPHQCTGFEFYVPYRYWMLNTITKEVVFCSAATLAGILGKDELGHDIVDSEAIANVRFYRAQNITPNENESIAETRYVRKRVEPPVVIKEITAVPEDTSRYLYEIDPQTNQYCLKLLATDGQTVIETIPYDDITSWNQETELPENYYAPKYEVVSTGNYTTLTVWARELINNKLPNDSPDLIEWKLESETGKKIPEYQYYYVAADDTFSLEGKEEVHLKDFEVDGKDYFIGNKAQIDGELKFVKFTKETVANLRGTTYGIERNTLDPATNTIQYYTLDVETQDAFYSLDGEFYYQNADEDWLRETLPKAAISDEIHYFPISEDPSDGHMTPVNNRIFVPNYFYKLVNGEYILAETFEPNTTYYEKIGKYVAADTGKIFEVGTKWNPSIAVPNGVTLATRNVVWQAQKLEGFAQNLNTINGLILKINNKLLSNDTLTRDRETVQGCINSLNDIINKFHTFTVKEILMVDDYGRVHSGDTDTRQSGTFTNIGTGATGTIAEAQNAWIKITNSIGNNHKPHIKLEHQLLHTENDTATTGNKNADRGAGTYAGLNNTTGDTLSLYTPIVDSMGHVIGKNTETVTLPYGFKTITTNGRASNNNTTELGTQNDIVADNTQDTLGINSGNEWIKVTTDNSADTITISHDVKNTTSTTSTLNLSTETSGSTTFTIPTYAFDNTNHYASHDVKTLTMPNSYGKFTGDNVDNQENPVVSEATATHDTFSITGDSWVTSTVGTDSISLAHSAAHNAVSITMPAATVANAVEPQFGDTFTLPDWTFDEKGHQTGISTHTVKIPQGSLTNGTGNIVTGLSLNASTGAITETKAYASSITLGNYTNNNYRTFNDNTTIGGALDSLVGRLDTLEGGEGVEGSVARKILLKIQTLDANLDASGTAQNNGIFVVSGITETDGILTGIDSVEVDAAGAAATALETAVGSSEDTGTDDTIYGAKAYAKAYTDTQIGAIEVSYIEDPEDPNAVEETMSLNELFAYIKSLEARIAALEPQEPGGGGE